ncbi:MAG: sugar porter family MFS transporter [Spirosomataceae bacterium]
MKERNNLYVTSSAIVASLGGFLVGFDSSVISGAIPFYKTVFGLQDGSFMLGFSVSCIIWGAILGNLLAGALSDKIGRKFTLLISSVLFLVTGVCCAFAPNIEIFISGRIIGGIGVGIAILIAPIYIAEISPAQQRGQLVSFNQLLIVLGLSSAYFSNYFILKLIDNSSNWRWMLGIEILPALLYFNSLLFIPESPIWLLMQGKKEQALAILIKIEGEGYVQKVYEETKKILVEKTTIKFTKQLTDLFNKRMKPILIIGFGLGIFQQFSGINAILYYAPMIFELAGGGRDAAFVQSMVLGIVLVITTIISMIFIDRLGRKPLLYIGVSLTALSLTATGVLFKSAYYQLNYLQIEAVADRIYKNELWTLAQRRDKSLINFDVVLENINTIDFKKENTIVGSLQLSDREVKTLKMKKNQLIAKIIPLRKKTFENEQVFFAAISTSLKQTSIDIETYKSLFLKEGIKINSFLVLISILGFITGFSISLGPVMWAMFSEIFPLRLRGLAISIVGAVNAIASFLVATFFPIQLARLGSSNTFFFYAFLMYLCLWFVWKYVVETKGKSLEQLEKELHN